MRDHNKTDEEIKNKDISIGRIILGSILIIGVIYSVSLLLNVAKAPNDYMLYDASAIQVTQVYTMALFEASIIIGFMLAGLLVIQVLQLMDNGDQK